MMDNLWIAALDPADRERIKPYLEEREVARGQMLYDAGEAVDQAIEAARKRAEELAE